MSLQPFRAFIERRLGLHFRAEDDARLEAILAQRVSKAHARDIAAYLDHVAIDPVELQRLTALLTVKETYFYREPRHLQLLVARLAPALLAQRHNEDPIRILSLGCSTGEEPYSIAIALRERYGQLAEKLFHICAGDIDTDALEHARAAVYGPRAFRALPAELRERWFSPIDERSHRLDPMIQRQVQFLPINVLARPYPEELAAQDVIFFRNVSVYFSVAARRQVMGRLSELLRERGHLIVAASETLANDFGLLRLYALDGVFVFGKAPPANTNRHTHPVAASGVQTTSRGARDKASHDVHQAESCAAASQTTPRPPSGDHQQRSITPPPPPADAANKSREKSPAELYAQALSSAQLERFEEALRYLAPLCERADAAAEHLKLQAHLLLEQGDITRAAAIAQRALEQDPWSAEALLLLGRCARLRGDTGEAISALRRAVYDDPTCWSAHYQLGEIYRAQGDTHAARREYRIVLRQIEDETIAMQGPGALPSRLSAKDLRLLCETGLAHLAESAA